MYTRVSTRVIYDICMHNINLFQFTFIEIPNLVEMNIAVIN